MPNMKLEYKHVNFSDINSIIDYGKDIYDSFNIEIKKLNKKTSLDEIISRMLLFTNELETIYNIGILDRQEYILNGDKNDMFEKDEIIDLFDYKLKFIFNNIDVWRSLLINQEIEPFRKRAIVEILLESINPNVKEKNTNVIIGWIKRLKSRSKKY